MRRPENAWRRLGLHEISIFICLGDGRNLSRTRQHLDSFSCFSCMKDEKSCAPEQLRRAAPPQKLHFDAIDRGPEPPPEQKAVAFESFLRGQTGRTIYNHGSFRRGLFIVRSFVEHHGGSVQFPDAEPHGLIGGITLPRASGPINSGVFD